MCTPMVVDANCIAKFQYERIHNINGPATAALNHIFTSGWIVACPKCIQKWASCAAGAGELALNDWIADKMSSREIRHVDQITDAALAKKLTQMGLPKEDIKWLQVARHNGAFGVVTEDIDLFDPRAKGAKDAARKKQARTGPIAKFARKSLNVEVMTLDQVLNLVPTCDL